MAEQPRNQVSEMHFDEFLNPSTFQCGKTSLKTEVCSCSGYPSEALRWIKEVEMVDSVEDLTTSQSKNFEILDMKIVSSLKKIIKNSNFKKGVNLAEQKAQLAHQFFCGRQIACMIYEYFWVIGAHESVLDCPDLFRTTFTWRRCSIIGYEMGRSLLISQVFNDGFLESFCKMRIRV